MLFLALQLVGIILIVVAFRVRDVSGLNLNLTYARWAVGLTGAGITCAASAGALFYLGRQRNILKDGDPRIYFSGIAAILLIAAGVCGILSVQWPS